MSDASQLTIDVADKIIFYYIFYLTNQIFHPNDNNRDQIDTTER